MSAIADTHAPMGAPATVKFDNSLNVRGLLVFLAVLAGGLFFMAYYLQRHFEFGRAGADDGHAFRPPWRRHADRPRL